MIRSGAYVLSSAGAAALVAAWPSAAVLRIRSTENGPLSALHAIANAVGAAPIGADWEASLPALAASVVSWARAHRGAVFVVTQPTPVSKQPVAVVWRTDRALGRLVERALTMDDRAATPIASVLVTDATEGAP